MMRHRRERLRSVKKHWKAASKLNRNKQPINNAGCNHRLTAVRRLKDYRELSSRKSNSKQAKKMLLQILLRPQKHQRMVTKNTVKNRHRKMRLFNSHLIKRDGLLIESMMKLIE